jgi:hypothetical protein
MVELTKDGPDTEAIEFDFDVYFPVTMQTISNFEKITRFNEVYESL